MSELENASEKPVNVNIAASDSVTITRYSTFLIGGTTPAIRATLFNNTGNTVSEVQATIKMNNIEMVYTAKQQIESRDEIIHSGWGLANDVKSIEVAIISYTTIDKEKYIVPQDELKWMYIEL